MGPALEDEETWWRRRENDITGPVRLVGLDQLKTGRRGQSIKVSIKVKNVEHLRVECQGCMCLTFNT